MFEIFFIQFHTPVILCSYVLKMKKFKMSKNILAIRKFLALFERRNTQYIGGRNTLHMVENSANVRFQNDIVVFIYRGKNMSPSNIVGITMCGLSSIVEMYILLKLFFQKSSLLLYSRVHNARIKGQIYINATCYSFLTFIGIHVSLNLLGGGGHGIETLI